MIWKVPRSRRVGLILVAATAAWVAWAWAPAGRATSDSASYLDGARHLARGEGFTSSQTRIGRTHPRPIVDFAPGFSILIALCIRAGFDARSGAALVLGASYVLYAVALHILLFESTGGRWRPLCHLLGAVLILHPGILHAVDTIGSDLPAAAVWLCAVALAMRLLRATEPERRTVVGAALCMTLALLMRWSMFYALLALSGALLLSLPKAWPLRRRLRSTTALALIPLSVLALCVLRNYFTTRTFLGYRRIVLDDPLRIAADALTGLGVRFEAGDLGNTLGHMRRAALVAFLVLVVFAFGRGRSWRRPPVRLLLGSAAGFSLLLVASAAVSPIDALSAPRFWLPVWPVLGAAALAVLSAPGIGGAAAKAAVAMFTAVLLLSGAGYATEFLQRLPQARSGRGFFKESLARSAPVRFVTGDGALDYTLLSNDPRAVLMYAGVDRIYELPKVAGDLDPLLRSGDVCILFFTQAMTSRIEARLPADRRLIEELRDRGIVERVASDPAGEVWLPKKARRS